jgi:CRP-like cAMP-binding protein
MTIEDPLANLPVSTIAEYSKGAVIYSPDSPSSNLYVVLSGIVKISRISPAGIKVILGVYRTDEIFGEASLAGGGAADTATALQDTRVMSWPASEIQELALSRPGLSLALLQMVVARAAEVSKRIESFSLGNIEQRLAAALLFFARRLGGPGENGGRQMISFTHEFLAAYVGTSREIVTNYMNYFRRRGALRYSRKSIEVFEDALRQLVDGGVNIATA